MGRRALLVLLVGLSAAPMAVGCDTLLGIRPVHVDDPDAGAGDAGTGGADAGACSPVAEVCSECAECGSIVEVTFDDFGAPTKPALPLTGTTAGASRSTVDPGVECTQALGPERIYAVHTGKAGYLTATLPRAGTSYDSVIYARKSCCATDDPVSHCSDSRKVEGDHSYHGGEVLSFRVAAGDVWYIFVDGSGGEAGDYTLDLDLAPGVACEDQGKPGWVPIAIEPGSPMTLSGNTRIFGNQGENRCFLGHPAGAGALGEIVYELRAPPSVTSFDLALNGTFDAVLYARSDCFDSNAGSAGEIVCQDQNAGAGAEFVSGISNKGSPVYVFVDTGPGAFASYEYTLIVAPK